MSEASPGRKRAQSPATNGAGRRARGTRRDRTGSQRAAKDAASARARRRTRKRLSTTGRRWLGALLLGAVTVLLAVGFLWRWGGDSAVPPASAPIQVRTLALESTTLEAVAELLEAEGLIENATAFAVHQRVFYRGATIEPGPHVLPLGASARDLVKLLARHQSRPTRTVTIPEGFDLFQVAARLEREGICPASGFVTEALRRDAALRRIGAVSFEGYLYPATYELRMNSTPGDVLERLVREAERRFAAVFDSYSGALHELEEELVWRRHDVITLASIVQKEVRDPSEAALVASVFFNRLRDPGFKPLRMLQSDPTAAYGCRLEDAPPSCRNFDGRVTPKLLRDPANRYNSYRHPGLPPGPICSPSAETVRQVLTAPATDYFFFVANGTGRHTFSRTFSEHNQEIQRGKK